MLRHALERQGYEVVEAHDQPTAVKLLQEAQPSLVLSDLRLPDGRPALCDVSHLQQVRELDGVEGALFQHEAQQTANPSRTTAVASQFRNPKRWRLRNREAPPRRPRRNALPSSPSLPRRRRLH